MTSGNVALRSLFRLAAKQQPARLMTTVSTPSPHLEVSVDNAGVRTIKINRPERLNAINDAVAQALPVALRDASQDWPNTRVTVIAGSKKSPYFGSGNDLADFLETFNKRKGDMKELTEEIAEKMVALVDAFVDFGPGLLVAAVHGPAMGFSATSLALCDAVFASDSARFNTPFTQLSQTPEGCSSHMFPTLMGRMKGTDILALCGTMTAQEAKQCGLVTEVLPEWNFDREVSRRTRKYAQLPPEGFRDTLALTRFRTPSERDLLRQINRAEAHQLIARWQSVECAQALAKFAQRKKKG